MAGVGPWYQMIRPGIQLATRSAMAALEESMLNRKDIALIRGSFNS